MHPRWLGTAAIVFATFSIISFAAATVSAQHSASSRQRGHRVAVLDVGYVLKNLPAIKAYVSKARSDLKRDEARRKQERDQLKQVVARLKTMKVGTEEYARQEELAADLDLKLRRKNRHGHHGVSEAETELIRENYQRIAAAAKTIANRDNIDLVLRIDSEQMNVDQSNSVMRAVARDVVYHDITIDITDAVMRHLEQPSKTTDFEPDGSATTATTR